MREPYAANDRSGAPPFGPGYRARQFANLLDSIVEHETENQRWLRNAAARLQEINGENNDGE